MKTRRKEDCKAENDASLAAVMQIMPRLYDGAAALWAMELIVDSNARS
jgi:hypothetical protein